VNGLLFIKIDISFEPFNCFGVWNWLCESPSYSERIGPSRCGSVKVFPLKGLRVNGYWCGLVVLSLRNAFLQLLISEFLSATVHARLDDQLLIALGHRNFSAVLCFHNFSTNNICSHVFFCVCFPTCCIEVSLSKLLFCLLLLLAQFFSNLGLDFLFEHLGFATNFWHIVSRVYACAPDARWRIGSRALDLTINAVSCVVKLFFSIYRVFKVKMPLRYVLFHYSPKIACYWNWQQWDKCTGSIRTSKRNRLPNSACQYFDLNYLPSPENSFRALSSCQFAIRVPLRVVVCLLKAVSVISQLFKFPESSNGVLGFWGFGVLGNEIDKW